MELARLRYEDLLRAQPRAAADIVVIAADVNGGIHAAIDEDFREHRCGGGFAVRAGNADGLVVALHQLPQQRRALHLRNAQPRGFLPLRVFGRDGRRKDDQVRAAYVFGPVADFYVDAALAHRAHVIAVIIIGAGNKVAALL